MTFFLLLILSLQCVYALKLFARDKNFPVCKCVLNLCPKATVDSSDLVWPVLLSCLHGCQPCVLTQP